MGHCNPKKEYVNVIASTNHLEILCFVTKPPLARLPKPTKSVLTFCTRQLAQWILSGPWRGRAGILDCPSGGKVQKHYDLGSEWSGEHLRYITQPWFQDDLGVIMQAMHWLVFLILHEPITYNYNCLIEIGFRWRGKESLSHAKHRYLMQYEWNIEREQLYIKNMMLLFIIYLFCMPCCLSDI